MAPDAAAAVVVAVASLLLPSLCLARGDEDLGSAFDRDAAVAAAMAAAASLATAADAEASAASVSIRD